MFIHTHIYMCYQDLICMNEYFTGLAVLMKSLSLMYSYQKNHYRELEDVFYQWFKSYGK